MWFIQRLSVISGLEPVLTGDQVIRLNSCFTRDSSLEQISNVLYFKSFSGFFESEAVPIDEITLEDSESYAIAMALDHAKSLGISKLEIRTDSKLRPPGGAEAPNGIEVNFVSIEDPTDKGFDMASELAYQSHIEHIELQKAVANKA